MENLNSDIQQIFQLQKIQSLIRRQSGHQERIALLQKLRRALTEHQEQILVSAQKDFGKPQTESLLTELLLIHHELEVAIKSLQTWMTPRSVSSGLFLLGGKSEIHFQSRGTCLIISPWNYPWQLSLGPLIAALAAGNTVILKPSELTPHSSDLLYEIVSKTFQCQDVWVFRGDKSVSETLLALPFDHIFFTGSTAVGKIVMQAASRHLATITLELGGKSPFVVEKSADLSWAAERLVWAKWVNAGQTCVAPDLLFVEESCWPDFQAKLLSEILKTRSWQTIHHSQIISDRHFERLQRLREDALIRGGVSLNSDFLAQQNPLKRQFCLDFIFFEKFDALTQTQLGTEEIFGPLMPVVLYSSKDELIKWIHHFEKPLALYVMSRNSEFTQTLRAQTSSGSFVVNDCLVHLANEHLPFGGVNHSGHGSYHGEFGFRAFSHERAVFSQGPMRFLAKYFSPPYHKGQDKILNTILKLRL